MWNKIYSISIFPQFSKMEIPLQTGTASNIGLPLPSAPSERIIFPVVAGHQHLSSCPQLPTAEANFQASTAKGGDSPSWDGGFSLGWVPQRILGHWLSLLWLLGQGFHRERQADTQSYCLHPSFAECLPPKESHSERSLILFTRTRTWLRDFFLGKSRPQNVSECLPKGNEFICYRVWSASLRAISNTVEAVVKGSWENTVMFISGIG